MDIVTELKTIAGTLTTTVEFTNGTEEWQNYLSDETEIPVLYLDEPITSDFTVLSNFYEEYPLRFLIGRHSELDATHGDERVEAGNTNEELNVIIQEMRTIAVEYLKKIINHVDSNGVKVFEKVEGGKMINVTHHFSMGVTGIYLEFILKPRQPEPLC